MIQNIAITSFDREFAKKVGKELSSILDMFYIDTIELYEFDHIPHTMTDMLKAQGVSEFRDKECGTIGYVTDFANTVITFESGAIKRKKNIKKIKNSCEFIYLYKDLECAKTILQNAKYQSTIVKKFFNVPVKTLEIRDNILQKNADFVINITRKSPGMVAKDIIAKITKKYTN